MGPAGEDTGPGAAPRKMRPGEFFASIPFDRRLYREDIEGSIAHARMLARQGIISEKEAELIIMGLAAIREEIERGEFPFRSELEDIHMNIEARLYEKIGELAGKLHTARSRNDQIALDMRLFVKRAISRTVDGITELQRALVEAAERYLDTPMPGYTHLQRAQPVLLSHHLLAYFEMFRRDKERFQDCLKRTDVLPLGSGALAGVTFPIDRDFLAAELGFGEVGANSLDAVSDRDFVLEYEACASLAMMHLSRLCGELVLWSSQEFGFVELAPEYTSGSSIMPQKRNPDAAELVRGKAGRVYGHLMALLTTMKGLPLSYNRDMQEDKEGLFDTVDTLLACLEVAAGMVRTARFDEERLRRAAGEGYLLATDLADYLTKKGLPFREAHHAVSQLVRYAAARGKDPSRLSLEELRRFSPLFDEGVYDITLESALRARRHPGGTAPEEVARALERAKRLISPT